MAEFAWHDFISGRTGMAHGPGAERRALALLRACLTPKQRRQLDAEGWFDVTGSVGGTYRIETGRTFSGNIYRMDDYARQLCCHSRDPLPLGDHWLLQKLAIEADEPRFLDTACYL